MKMTSEQMEELLAPTYRVGVYCRLSKEDEDQKGGESQSIGHQREIIEEFCKRKGWAVEEYYTDDGFTGTSSIRPALQKMLADVEAKRINVVVTKDYSRLGRDNLFTENLREIWFPKHGCRYVAINDNIDTMYDDDFAPFKALFNAQYSKDISKKVHSAYVNQAEKGRFTGCVAPFGYMKDPADPCHLIIDQETAPYAKRIFEWAKDGYGVGRIKRRLEAEKVPCPTWWNNIRLKLISAEMNPEYLADKPHQLVEDLAVVYYVDLGETDQFGKATTPITDNLLKAYGITQEEQHEIATTNMERCVTPQFQDMDSMLRETMLESLPTDMPREMKEQIVDGVMAGQGAPMMYILTNEDKLNGASMLLSDRAMEMVRKTVGDDFFILPSSIHETLIVPKTDDMSLENLEKMVREVNATDVKPGERLSDHVYEYDAEERSIVRADKVEERRQEKETMQKDVKTAEERAGNPEKASAREGKADRDEGRVSFKQKLPEMKEKAAEQTKANPVAENAKKKAQEIA